MHRIFRVRTYYANNNHGRAHKLLNIVLVIFENTFLNATTPYRVCIASHTFLFGFFFCFCFPCAMFAVSTFIFITILWYIIMEMHTAAAR